MGEESVRFFKRQFSCSEMKFICSTTFAYLVHLLASKKFLLRGLISILLVLLYCSDATAAGYRCQNMEEYVLGWGIFLPAGIATAKERGSERAFRFEAGELGLFEIPDLKIDFAKVSHLSGRFDVSVYLSALQSPAGGEKLYGSEIALKSGGRLVFACGFQLYSGKMIKAESIYSLRGSARMFARISRTLLAGYVVTNLPLSGREYRGVDMSVFIGLSPVEAFSLYTSFSMQHYGAYGSSLCAVIGWPGVMKLLCSYEGDSEMLKGALVFQLGRFKCSAGAGLHPVLGLSQGVSLSLEV